MYIYMYVYAPIYMYSYTCIYVFIYIFQVAAELFDFGQEALFLPEDMQDAAEKVFQTAKDLNPIFESCQIILGEVQDRKCRRQRLVYV